jgi:2-polyprenyl-6-hydroxyphenyl methylase/3-demethylubiquinone-9 3-methyltransferase
MMSDSADEIRRGARYDFGANWRRYLRIVNDERIVAAERSIREKLGVEHLRGRSFLDIGSGSGIFSLAARRLGARVHSFDFDSGSVECTTELRKKYFKDDPSWTIAQASVLDSEYMRSLGKFDVAYSWGVLHHTGDMWKALDHAARAVAENGFFFISIYNDQGSLSVQWRRVKKLYCSGPLGRSVVTAAFVPYFILQGLAVDAYHMNNPLARYRERARGMSAVVDWLDWLGGYPFEVARPEQIFDFCRARGFELRRLVTGSSGCNEFVFKK